MRGEGGRRRRSACASREETHVVEKVATRALLERIDKLGIELVVGEPGSSRHLHRRGDGRKHVDLARRVLHSPRPSVRARPSETQAPRNAP